MYCSFHSYYTRVYDSSFNFCLFVAHLVELQLGPEDLIQGLTQSEISTCSGVRSLGFFVKVNFLL